MKSSSVWNITFTIKKNKFYLNASVFFFLVIPFICYKKYTSEKSINFLLTYASILILWFLYKIIYAIIKKEGEKLYPFGIASLKPRDDIKYNKIDKIFAYFIEPVFAISTSYVIYINNFFSSAIIFPLMLLTFSLITFLRNSHIITGQNTNLILSTIFLFISMFYTRPEFVIFFISFLYYTFSMKIAFSLDDIGEEYFVRNIMTNRDSLKILSPTDSVGDIIDDVIKTSQKFFPVMVNEKIVGTTRKEEIMLQFKTSIVGDYPIIEEFMIKTNESLSPDDNIKKAKEVFDDDKISAMCLPVVKDDKFLGLLVYEFFLEFISIKKFLFKFKV